jgi:tetratricopeptide (TPR) repeat protein
MRRASSSVSRRRSGTADPDDTFRSVRRLVEGLARERPLVLVFDDVHWAEASLLDLIEDVADWSRDAPILLLCVGRQELLEARPTWGGGKLASTTIQLEPLSAAESDELVVGLLGRADLDATVRLRIAEAADGNPLFVEELLGMLIDDGSLVRDDGTWSAARDMRSIAVPPTIQALLAARLDRLERPERSVIECGAVEGKVFHAGAVAALVPDPLRDTVPSHLLGLQRKELVRRDRSAFRGDEAYRFRHLLIRDAAYDAMPKQARAELHERFANWLEAAAGERATEYEEILGYHLEQAHRYRSELALADADAADLGPRAGHHLGSAGLRAADRGDYHAAQGLLERAATLLRDDPRRAVYLDGLGEVAYESVGPRDSLPYASDAMRAYEVLGDPLGAARAELNVLWARSSIESLEPEPIVERGRELIALFDAAGDVEGWARAVELVTGHLFFLGRSREAIALATSGLDRVGIGSVARSRLSIWVIPSIFWGPTPVDEAIAMIEEVVRDNPGRPKVETSGARTIGGLKAMRGDFDEARAEIARSTAIAAEAGLQLILDSSGSHFLVNVELLAGNPQAAFDAALPSYEALAASGDVAFASTSAGFVGRALVELGRLDEAERFARIATDTAAQSDHESQSVGREVRAAVLARRGEFEEGERIAREAVSIRAPTDDLNGQGNAHLALAEVLQRAGRSAAAAEALREAVDRFGRKGNVVMVERANRELAELSG